MVYMISLNICMAIPPKRKLDVTLGVRMSEDEKVRADLLARHAQARSTSDYLRPAIEAFLDREQKRLRITNDRLVRDAETLRGERRRKASGE